MQKSRCWKIVSRPSLETHLGMDSENVDRAVFHSAILSTAKEVIYPTNVFKKLLVGVSVSVLGFRLAASIPSIRRRCNKVTQRKKKGISSHESPLMRENLLPNVTANLPSSPIVQMIWESDLVHAYTIAEKEVEKEII